MWPWRRTAGRRAWPPTWRSCACKSRSRTRVSSTNGRAGRRTSRGARSTRPWCGRSTRPSSPRTASSIRTSTSPWRRSCRRRWPTAARSRPRSWPCASTTIGVVRGSSGRPRPQRGYGYSVRRPGNFFRDYTRWNAAITLTILVFDGFRSGVAQAKRGASRQPDRIALENQIRLSAKQARRAVTAGRVLGPPISRPGPEGPDMTQATTAGRGHALDVLDAQAALTLAESLRLEALYAHANARAVLRWVMGRDPLDTATASASTEAQTKAGSE